MKRFLLLLYIFITAHSCKSTQEITNNNLYTTPAGISRLTTDLPKKHLVYQIKTERDVPENDGIIKQSAKREIIQPTTNTSEIIPIIEKTEPEIVQPITTPISEITKEAVNSINDNNSAPVIVSTKTEKTKQSPKEIKPIIPQTNLPLEKKNVIPKIIEQPKEKNSVPLPIPKDTIINNASIKFLDSQNFANKIAERTTQILDVRSENLYKKGRLFDAMNIDIKSSNFTLLLLSSNLNKDRPVAIYSETGKGSFLAAKALSINGFKNIFILNGGIEQWKKDGKKIENY